MNSQGVTVSQPAIGTRNVQPGNGFDSQSSDLAHQGFTRFPGVLATQQVQRIRSLGESYYASTGQNWISPDMLFQTPELRELPFRPVCVQAMRALLGEEFYILPDFAVNLNKFGGWHRDTGSQIAEGLDYIYDRDFLHLTFGLYFQENDAVFGGGLDVVPRSHQVIVPGPIRLKTSKLEALRDRVRLKMGACHSIPCLPGDLLAFDFRILHRSTLPKRERPKELPMRIAAFWGVVRERRHAEAYVEHLRRRAASDDYYAHLFPGGRFEFPPEVRRLAEQAGCGLCPA